MSATPRPVTPNSPKSLRIKSPRPGIPLYGCEHLQMLLSGGGAERMRNTITHYKGCLRAIFDNTPIIPQTSKTAKGHPRISLAPNYLCLQCTTTTTAQDRLRHGTENSHRFYVESRSGALYCQMCDDFVWDPTMEDIRMKKLGTGPVPSRKRKLDELFTDTTKDEPISVATHTIEAPCRASGIRGIYNMGATCYMNVILQSFVHNPLLRNYYLGDGHQRTLCRHEHCMSCAMDDMFQEFYAQENTVGYTAANILGSFWLSKRKAYEELVTNKEQDAHEFFQFLTEELHEINGGIRSPSQDDLPPAKRARSSQDLHCKCIIHQTFYGRLQSTITCKKCSQVNVSAESFMDLSLGLDVLVRKKSLKAAPVLTLERCLDEEYKNSEACEYTCYRCKSTEATRLLSIKSLPNVLCIQLKRFKQKNGVASKIDAKVQFPLQLKMFPYTNRARHHDALHPPYELERSCRYDLQSVVVHVGALDTGHYVSYSRSGNQWFRFNDHTVTLASKSDVLNEQAFLLFYVIQSLG